MDNLVISTGRKVALLLSFTLFLAACGGGSSSSSGPSPEQVNLILFPNGEYTGSFTVQFSGENIIEDPVMNSLRITVSGIAGNQQARIAFLQFSGTSAIGMDGEFRIPSGQFPLPSDLPGGACQGEFIFDGIFADSAASGNLTGEFVCPGINGPVTASGTFTATLGAAKVSLSSSYLSVRSTQ